MRKHTVLGIISGLFLLACSNTQVIQPELELGIPQDIPELFIEEVEPQQLEDNPELMWQYLINEAVITWCDSDRATCHSVVCADAIEELGVNLADFIYHNDNGVYHTFSTVNCGSANVRVSPPVWASIPADRDQSHPSKTAVEDFQE